MKRWIILLNTILCISMLLTGCSTHFELPDETPIKIRFYNSDKVVVLSDEDTAQLITFFNKLKWEKGELKSWGAATFLCGEYELMYMPGNPHIIDKANKRYAKLDNETALWLTSIVDKYTVEV